MPILGVLIALFLLAVASSGASEAEASAEDGVKSIGAFIAAVPNATTQRYLAWAVKSPEEPLRIAFAKCDAWLAKGAAPLRTKLLYGEGRDEPIACFTDDKEGDRIRKLLDANLIAWSFIGDGLGSQVSVSQAHAARARFLIAKMILNVIGPADLLRSPVARITIGEGLEIGLVQVSEGGTRWASVKPEDVVREYSEASP